MDDQIVKTILEDYSERGIDLSELVSNPIFKGLSLQAKVNALKSNADKILSGTSKNPIRAESFRALKSAAGMSALAGVAGIVTGLVLKRPTAELLRMAGKSSAIAGGASLGLSALSGKQILENKNSIRASLENLAKTPDDNHALRVIIREGNLTPANRFSPMEAIYNKLAGIEGGSITGAQARGAYVNYRTNYYPNPARDPVREKELTDIWPSLKEQHSKTIFPPDNNEDIFE